MALSADKDVYRGVGEVSLIPVKIATNIYKGALTVVETSGGTAGYLKPGVDGANLSFLGVAYEQCLNTGASGALSVPVEQEGTYKFKKTSATQADIGKIAYIVDDETVAVSTTNNVKCGKIVELVDSGNVRVKIDVGDL